MGKEKILLVEDENDTSTLLSDVLVLKGYSNIHVANNGYEGLEIYKETKPNIVLMDLEMPLMNGYDSSRKIKKYDPHANIVLIPENPQSPFARKTLEEGYAVKVLKKPFSFDELLKTIKTLLASPTQAH